MDGNLFQKTVKQIDSYSNITTDYGEASPETAI